MLHNERYNIRKEKFQIKYYHCKLIQIITTTILYAKIISIQNSTRKVNKYLQSLASIVHIIISAITILDTVT